jgi:large subunit ribosomal protein L4e
MAAEKTKVAKAAKKEVKKAKVSAPKAKAPSMGSPDSPKLTKTSKNHVAKLLTLKGAVKGEVTLPDTFSTEYRPDIILRAFSAEKSWEKQPFGSDPRAGFKTTADYYSRRREYYRMTMNRGMSRLPRVKRPKGGLGEVKFVPHSKGGHRAHPPKTDKVWAKKINEKEWILALKSAIAATANAELATGFGRNHAADGITLPLVIENSFESLVRTKDIEDVFEKLGVIQDIERASKRKVKAGKARTGKLKYRTSILVVVSQPCDAVRASENLAGIDVVDVDGLDVGLLAPGGFPGRLTLWTEGAIEMLSK